MKNLEQPGGCECIKLYLVGNKWLPLVWRNKIFLATPPKRVQSFLEIASGVKGRKEFSGCESLLFFKKEENSPILQNDMR